MEELYRREPHLGPGARGALEVPDEGIDLPVHHAARIRDRSGAGRLRAAARHARRRRSSGLDGGGFGVRRTAAASWTARFLVNAAGLRSDELDRMLGHDGFTVTPRRGELIVFDKLSRPLVAHIVLAVPTKVTKGVLIAPTVFGNVMLGPTAEDVERKDDTALHGGGARLSARGGRAHHAGAARARGDRGLRRAARRHRARRLSGDVHADEGYACVGGIRSTGLSASMAIAEHVRDELGPPGCGSSRGRAARAPHAEHRRALRRARTSAPS